MLFFSFLSSTAPASHETMGVRELVSTGIWFSVSEFLGLKLRRERFAPLYITQAIKISPFSPNCDFLLLGRLEHL